jgi:PAS domain S-box-containing protein
MDDLKDAAPSLIPYHRLRFTSEVVSLAVVAIGIMVMFGWITDLDFLKRLTSDSVAMNPVSALSFIAAGTALFLSQEKFSNRYLKVVKTMASVILVMGALKIFLLLTGIPFPFDQVLFKKDLWEPGNKIMNSIAPNTAINFVLIGWALLVLNQESKKGKRPAQYLAIISSLLSLISLYGYVYGITSLYTVTSFLPMALHTAVCFFLLSLGILLARPDKGSMAIVIGESSGQIIFMRFLALVLPLLFGWLRLKGEHAGYYTKETGTAIFAVLTYIMAMYLLGRRSYLQHQLRKTRKIAMDAIKENERRLQAILDHSGTLISLKTPLGNYTLVNKQFEKAFKLDEGSVLNKRDMELFPKEIAEELHEYDQKVLQFAEPQSFEEKYPQADGIHTYLTIKFPLFDQDQKIYALGAVSTDITKRKRLEEELRKSHKRLFGILDNIGEGVIVVDADGNIILFNKRAEEILGTGAVTVPWEEWSKTYGFYQADGTSFFKIEEMPLYKAINGMAADNIEILIRNDKTDDAGKWISLTGRPVYNDENEIIAGVVVFRDITLSKNLERLFTENEKRLKVILSSIGEGVIVVNQEQEIMLFNKKAEELLGSGPKNLPLAHWPEEFGIFETESEALFSAENLPLARALKGEIVEELEVLIRNEANPDGIRLKLTSKPIRDVNGQVTGGMLDLRDITEQRLLEEYLLEMRDSFKELLNQKRPSA